MVPEEVLDDVYRASGMEREWLIGSRDMELAKAGWDVLQMWIEAGCPAEW